MQKEPLRVAIIGLDTSHAVEFPRLMQDDSVPAEHRVSGMRATRCLRFETPFQGKDGLDQRQAVLEKIGVEVTDDFDYAIGDCDAILLEVNDPALHWEYFSRCAKLGKPVFLDKPFADTLENMNKIIDLAPKEGVRYFTASSLRYDLDMVEALSSGIKAESATIWGPVGKAASGSSLIWYGVHTFEMLERIMGLGAEKVFVSPDSRGYVCHVVYKDGRRGVVDLTYNAYRYGGVIRDNASAECMFQSTGRIPFYHLLLLEIREFFLGRSNGVDLRESMEIMAMLVAAERSLAGNSWESVEY